MDYSKGHGIHAYFAKPGFQQDLLFELTDFKVVDEQLILSSLLCLPAFALDIWPNCEILSFQSISDAVKQLKTRALRWYYYGSRCFRRGALIAAQLKQVKESLVHYKNACPKSVFAAFTMLDEHHLLICKKPWKEWPCGKIEFIENKIIPPNRAYLKLWEALTLMKQYPQAGETVLDLGASPGGWSWVLSETGAHVIAVDKAPLSYTVLQHANIEFQAKSAFALEPNLFKQVTWLCADIICYPKKLVSLIQKWQSGGNITHMVCTIKLQGQTDWEAIKILQKMPNAMVTHLFHNKHELTFLWPFVPDFSSK